MNSFLKASLVLVFLQRLMMFKLQNNSEMFLCYTGLSMNLSAL